jgi:tungstate transport system substrate-binding protein
MSKSNIIIALAAVVIIALAVALPLTLLGGVSGGGTLKVATTTSIYDTGLWDYLEPMFEAKYGVDVLITSKGSGQALALGETGDVDVVTVHDPVKEENFIAGGYAVEAIGYGLERVPWAYNYFIIVGPADDPAAINGSTPEEAFQKIQQQGAANPAAVKFVSRGDDSGTHGREQTIWAAAGYDYETDIRGTGAADGWYIEAGTGMGATLVMASEQNAYTLTDKGTFLAYQGDLDLVNLVEQGDIMLNVYTVIICKNGSNLDMSQRLVEFLRAPEIQALINAFGVPQYGESLFYAYDPAICD